MRIFITIRTLISYLLLLLVAPLFVVPCFIIACLPKKIRSNNRLFFFLLYLFYRAVVFLTFNSLRITGKKNIPQGVPVIFVANHQSSLDVPVIGMLTAGAPHIWFVLKYYVNTPVLGFFIRRMFVPVDKASEVKAASSLIKLLEVMEQHQRDLIIFPEGGRFTDGKIHTFYRGFAFIASKTKVPVIPVYMPNNGKIYPPYSFLVYNYPIDVIIGEPYIYGPDDTDKLFTERVYHWFVGKASKRS